MSGDKPIGLRLSVTPTERDRIQAAAEQAGYSSMAHFSREIVLQVAELFQPGMPKSAGSRAWYKRLTAERKAWLIDQLTQG
jgi:hypothetical protein